MGNKIDIEIKRNMFPFQFRQRKTLLSLFDINPKTSSLIIFFFFFLGNFLSSFFFFSNLFLLFFFLILSSEDPNVLREFTSNWQVNWINFDYLHFGLSVYPKVFIILYLCFTYSCFYPSILDLLFNSFFVSLCWSPPFFHFFLCF